MAEYTSPYNVEGFENPTMAKVFTDLLMISPPVTQARSSGSTAGTSAASCPSSTGQPPLTSASADTSTPQPTSFLKTMLIHQRAAADSLMATAKKINPVAKTINRMEDAYDAAFETDVKASLPVAGQTLQGFALLLFFVSFISLVLVGTIVVNNISKSGKITAAFFIGSVVIGMILLNLIKTLG
jgi:hypothetical protein